ncbi:ABC transporter transmembrane domain-containing protein [Streptomyces sp. NPDC048172]|uniref:ABC transporter transmembrane domain-containing protein n=1 Tax=Streptomyces sp. NPDC048172 TaxID=3365505 RepID=UPI0037249E35
MQIRDLPYPDPGVPDTRSGFRLLLWLGRSQLGGQGKALGWGLMHLVSAASLPVATGLAVDAVVAESGGKLATAGGVMALLAITVTLGDTMLHRVAVTNWITASARVQQLLARRASELGATLTRRVAAGEVVAVSTGDIEKIGWCVESASRFSAALLTTLAVCGGLMIYQPALGLLVGLGMVVLALAVLPLLPKATGRADFQREKAGRATELAADTVAGLRVLRGIGGEELFLGRYRRVSQEVRHAAVRTARMWALIEAVQVALPGLLLLCVVWFGANMALDGRIAVGELVTVYGAVMFLLFPLRLFQEFAMAYSFSRPSAARAARVLALRREPAADEAAADEAEETQEPREAQETQRAQEAQDVSAAGAGAESAEAAAAAKAAGETTAAREADGNLKNGGSEREGGLYDPSSGLRARNGELTAVVCGDPDAAGRLAERLGGHPAVPSGSGSVLLNGMALDDLTLDAARTAVLVQDKDPVLLSGTLAELLDVPSSGKVTVERALEAAQCADVLTALTQGSPDAKGEPLRARVTERGRSLSGGQRQRLALARSLITDPEVLVLDEPTSAVDSHTEARIARGLKQLREARTTVVLTSSPLLLDRADRVVFVHDGSAAASGTHRDLVRRDPAYRAVVTREPEPAVPPLRAALAGQPEGAESA